MPCSCTCKTCGTELGKETIAKTAHTAGDWTVTKKATCTEKGKEVRKCTGCGKVMEERSLSALGHDNRKVVTPPTKTEQGFTTTTCTRCGKETVGDFVDALGSEGLAWKLNEDGKTVTITGIGTCTDSKVAIPTKIEGHTVNAIADRAFYQVTGVTEMTIPASIKTIGNQIFFKCADLKTVYYNSTYGDDDNLFFSASSVTKVVFGGKNVPYSILKNATKVTEVVIAEGVTSIVNGAFAGCTGLASLVIPEGVTSIGGGFDGCSSLSSITLPNTVTDLDLSVEK